MAAGFVSSHYSQMPPSARFLAHAARPRRPASLPLRAVGIAAAHESISVRARIAERSSLSFPCIITANKVFGELATGMAAGFASSLSAYSPLPSSARFHVAGTGFADASRPIAVRREAGDIVGEIDEDEPGITWFLGVVQFNHKVKDKFMKKKENVIEGDETIDAPMEEPNRKRKRDELDEEDEEDEKDEEDGEEVETPRHPPRKIH